MVRLCCEAVRAHGSLQNVCLGVMVYMHPWAHLRGKIIHLHTKQPKCSWPRQIRVKENRQKSNS